MIIKFQAEILADGRKRVIVTPDNLPPASYSTVRNIDGSNRLMRDNAYWSFLPYEWEYAAYAAIAAAEGKPYHLSHCVPANHILAGQPQAVAAE